MRFITSSVTKLANSESHLRRRESAALQCRINAIRKQPSKLARWLVWCAPTPRFSPSVSCMTMSAGKAHALLATLLEGIEVCSERMHANLEASGGFPLSERAMLVLAPHIGKESARHVIQRVAAMARREGRSFAAALAGDRDVRAYLTEEELHCLTAFDAQVGHCQALVDRVLSTQRGSANSEFVG